MFFPERRYQQHVSDLPKKSSFSAYLGKIAESRHDAFLNLNDLTRHAIIAGATGGGKTVAAHVIAEEALLHGIGVIAFDPTAQWSGFLKPLDDLDLLNQAQHFDMGLPRSFPTMLYEQDDPVDIHALLNSKELSVFLTHDLDERSAEQFIAAFIEAIFRSDPVETDKLRLLLFFDEVHRILPKYGAHGEGFIALERAVREFRKWGIGIVFLSQVLEDFVGAIRANIATEVQMRTGYEDDLAKIRLKYGEDMAMNILKAQTGTGMLHNADYNIGRPYFVRFRPPYHSQKRLPQKDITLYLDLYRKLKNKPDAHFAIEQLKHGKLSQAAVFQ